MLIKGTGNVGILIWLGAYRDVSMKMGIVQELLNLAPPPISNDPWHIYLYKYMDLLLLVHPSVTFCLWWVSFFFWPNCDRSIQIHIIHLLDKFQIEVVNSMYHHQGKWQWSNAHFSFGGSHIESGWGSGGFGPLKF